jgi:hypothetical protein
MSFGEIRRLDDSFFADLEEIDKWLQTIGLVKHNRFRVYKKNLQWLRDHDQEHERKQIYDKLTGDGRLTEALSTYDQCVEIVEAIPILREKGINIPVELLKRALSGPVDTFKEDENSNQGRNAMFELSVGAMVARQEMHPILNVDNPDIAFEFNHRRIKVECKRVISENKVLERIEQGIKQLRKSVRTGTDDVGIVAISLSKVMNPGDRIAIVPESTAPHDLLSEELRRVLQANERQIARLVEPAITAILFYLSSPCFVSNRGYTRAKCGTIFPMNLSEQPFLRELAASILV